MKRADISQEAEGLQITEHYLLVGLFLNKAVTLKDIDKMYGDENHHFWKGFYQITQKDKINNLDELNAYILEKYSNDQDLDIDDLAYIYKEISVQLQGGFRGFNMCSIQLNALADKVWKGISSATFEQKIHLIERYPGTQLENHLAKDLVAAAKNDKRKLAKLLKICPESSQIMFKTLKKLGELFTK